MPRKTASATKKQKARRPARGWASSSARKPSAKKTRAKSPKSATPQKKLERTRVIFPMTTYEPNKDAIKKPLKDLGMKWQFLGEGRGRYATKGAQAFVQFAEAGADFTVWGEDAKKVKKILDAWEPFRSKEFTKEVLSAEGDLALEEAVRTWNLSKPSRQSGEPETFFARRIAAWEASDPRKSPPATGQQD